MKEWKTGETMHGFELVTVSELPEFRCRGLLFRHIETGCEVYHNSCDDRENLFAFAFKTLPSDSTGVSHILEHTVLCGSRRFPLKDPFLLLMKGSMNTFLNAFTFPDKTVYPASSTVPKDLFNIMKVYGDAVFFPLLRKEMFQQEGHRLQFNADGELELTGVVYNEMKGNYSTHDSIAGEWAYRGLLPDTPYWHDSGGDPAEIPELSFESFLAFHKTYYHPSNTRIYLYGNIPTEDYLEFLQEEFLQHFSGLDVQFPVARQPRWDFPQLLEKSYPSEPGEPVAGSSSVTMNWLLGPVTNAYDTLAAEVLTEVLLGTSGSPLQKAIVESDLGEDLSAPTGIETELAEVVFSVGIRGTDPEKKDDVEALILGELRRLVHDGLHPDMVLGAMRKVEFRHREIRGGGPFGLRLMRRSLRGWLHGAGPEKTLEFSPWFEKLKEELEKNPRYFETVINKWLVENPHRTTLIVKPDPELSVRERHALEEKMAALRKKLSPEESQRVRGEQDALVALQETPDRPEDVANIPFLRKSDVPREVERIPFERATLGSVPVYTHEFFTNDVVYLDLAFDISGLPDELLYALPLFTDAITECGVPGIPYDQLALQLALHTGGFSAHLEANPRADDPSHLGSYLFFRLKALSSALPDAVGLVTRILTAADFSQSHRIIDLVQQLRNDFKSSVIPGGSSFVALRAATAFSPAAELEEKWRGLSQLLYLDTLDEESHAADIAARLEAIRAEVLRVPRLSASVTASPEAREDAFHALRRITEALPQDGRAGEAGPVPGAMLPGLPEHHGFEALHVPATVNYVGAALPGAAFGTPDHAAEVLLAHLLRTGYLWEQVRMKGGAYGASASTRGLERVFTFASYRDPNIVATLRAYRGALELFAREVPDAESLELAVLALVGKELRPYSPGEKGAASFRRQLYRISDELRQSRRDMILSATPDALSESARRLLAAFEKRVCSVMGGRNAISEAAKEIPELQKHTLDIPL